MEPGQYQGGMDTQGYYTGGPPSDVYMQDGDGTYGPPLMTPDAASSGGDGTKSYMNYTEKGGQGQLDPDCGIAPRRLTDCVCLFVFLAYVLGMVILVTYTKTAMINNKPWGDVQRLTHGMDYQARLCGIDDGVEDTPYLFWCRSYVVGEAKTATPTEINTVYPTCVAKCPTSVTDADIACLTERTSAQQSQLPGGQFGNVKTFHIHAEQNIVSMAPYKTTLVGGRYCVPEDTDLKGQVMGPFGPLNVFKRIQNAIASFQDPWLVLFLCSIIACVVGYVYIYLIQASAKCFIYTFLSLSYALFLAGTLFFAFGVVGLLGGNAGPLLDFEEYKDLNPLYSRMQTYEASVTSVVVAAVLGCMSCGILGTFTHVGGHVGDELIQLIDAAAEVFMAMRSMLIPPLVQALIKYIFMWVLAYNFMYLVSVGWYEMRRIEVNGEYYMGADARYHFDWWILPWILYYIYGWVWIMEIANAIGHFLISFCVISWYFMKKDGFHKTGVPNMPLWKGTEAMLVYHMGSICLGAALVPWFRLVRLLNWFESEAVPDEDATFCEGYDFINGICRTLGKCGACFKRKNCCTPACCTTEGAAYRFSKNAYPDVIIRSQHFIPASSRSISLISKYNSTQQYVLEGKGCQLVTVVGSISIGIICSLICYVLLLEIPTYEDETGSAYIPEPLMVCFLCFILCGPCIGYGFMMLFDHTVDTLLYCYAHNKKHSRNSDGAPVDDYLPESLADIVAQDYGDDDGYVLYGNARPEMYLSTWLPSRRKDKNKLSDKERMYNMSMGTSGSRMGGTRGSGMYTSAPYDSGYARPYGGAMASQGFAGDYGPGSPGGYAGGYGSPTAGYGGYGGSG